MATFAAPRSRPLTVVIDARVRPGIQGGVQQAILGLAHGLGGLEGPERYHFLVDGDSNWLRPYLRGSCVLLQADVAGRRSRRLIDWADRRHVDAGLALRYAIEARGRLLPDADPAVKDVRPDLVHFMRHRGWRTLTPNLYVPHDVQHLHLPHHFTRRARTYRRLVYGAMAAQATRIVALTAGQVGMLAAEYNRPAGDIVVVPWASVLSLYPAAEALPAGLPDRFALYPAFSWPHKNHLRLIDALALLRDSGIDVPVVLTGGRDSHWGAVCARAEARGVADLLVNLGYVGDATMRALYAAADLMVFPSTYEGFGLPVVEAFEAGTAVVCADIPPLDRMVGNAGRTFDAHDPGDMAAAMAAVWTGEELRRQLGDRGRVRGSTLTWAATALRYRALYRQLTGVATAADLQVLAQPPPL